MKTIALVLVMMVTSQLAKADSYGAINGNVPNLVYDNTSRIYTMIVVPANYTDPLSQKVLTTFGGDQTIRQRTIVRSHASDSQFVERWGSSFPEAQMGQPTVAVIHETGGQAKAIYKMPMTESTNLKSELDRVKRAIMDCPNCPNNRPSLPFKPGPLRPNNPLCPNTPAPTQPTLPPIDNTPVPAPIDNTPEEDTEDNDYLLFAAVIGAVVAVARYFQG